MVGGGFHRVGVGGGEGDFFLHQFKLGQRLSELPAGVARAIICPTQNLAAPVQLAPKVVRPKSNTVSASFKPLPTCPRMFSLGTQHIMEGQPGGGGSANADFFHAGFDDFKPFHVRRDQKRSNFAVRFFLVRSAGHYGENAGDAAVGDVAFFAVQNISAAIGRGFRAGLHVGGIGTGFGFGQCEGGQLFAVGDGLHPTGFLCGGAKSSRVAKADE